MRHRIEWVAAAPVVRTSPMERQTLDQRPDLPYGRILLPRSLQAICEMLSETEGVSSQPRCVFDSLERSIAGEQSADDLVLDRLLSILPRACLALQQASSTGWPSVRLFRSLVSYLADLSKHITAGTRDIAMEANPPESQTISAPAAASMSNLLTCLWMLCQLSMTLDQVNGFRWPANGERASNADPAGLIAAIAVVSQRKGRRRPWPQAA